MIKILNKCIQAHYTDGRGLALDQGVIVVNMNYRLGTLGFLSGIDDEHRGNFGVRQGSTAQTDQSCGIKI